MKAKKLLAMILSLTMILGLCTVGARAISDTAEVATLEALNTALANNYITTIKLTADITGDTITNPNVQTGTVTVGTDRTLTLDLNGHKISTNLATDGNSYYNAHVVYVNGGNLTITDTSEDRTGELINTNSSSNICTRVVLVTGGGTLVMNGGTVTATSGEGMRIDNATVTLNEGATVQALYGNDDDSAYSWDNAVAGIEVRGNSTVTIAGATVKSNGQNAIYSDQSTDNITISSGVFWGSSTFEVFGGDAAESTITITGGYFRTDPSDYLDVTVYKTVVQDGGTYDGYYQVVERELTPNTVYTFAELKTVLDNATFDDAVAVTLGADIEITSPVRLLSTSSITIPEGFELSVTGEGVLLNDGKITNNGTLSASDGGFVTHLLKIDGEGDFEGYPVTDPYTVSTAMDLEWLSWLNRSTLEVSNVVLTDDITFPEGVEFDPIGIFAGEFDGCGHTISGLNLRSTSADLGLFAWLGHTEVDHTYVKNLTINEVLTTVKARCGGLAAITNGNVHISNVTMNGTMTATGATYYFAPFVGYAYNNGHHIYFGDCTTNMNVTANSGANIGPIIGSTGNSQSFTIGVYNFTNTGAISATGANNSVGYVMGYSMGSGAQNPITVEVINYNNTGSITNNYGTYTNVGTGSSWLCCNDGSGWGANVYQTTYIGTSNTAYYHEDEDLYSTTRPPVAKIGVTKYNTLAEAYTAAEAGNTIELLSDAPLTDTLTISKAITIDGKGHKIYPDTPSYFENDASEQSAASSAKNLVSVNTDGALLKDLTIEARAFTRFCLGVENGHKLTVNNVNVDVRSHSSRGNDAIQLNGGLIIQGKLTIYVGAVLRYYSDDGKTHYPSGFVSQNWGGISFNNLECSIQFDDGVVFEGENLYNEDLEAFGQTQAMIHLYHTWTFTKANIDAAFAKVTGTIPENLVKVVGDGFPMTGYEVKDSKFLTDNYGIVNETSGEYFQSLGYAAFYAQKGDTVKLLADANLNAGMSAKLGAWTLDANEKTLTVKGTLTITDGVYTTNCFALDGEGKIVLTGGTYSFAKPESWEIAAGYTAKDNGDGTWTVMPAALAEDLDAEDVTPEAIAEDDALTAINNDLVTNVADETAVTAELEYEVAPTTTVKVEMDYDALQALTEELEAKGVDLTENDYNDGTNTTTSKTVLRLNVDEVEKDAAQNESYGLTDEDVVAFDVSLYATTVTTVKNNSTGAVTTTSTTRPVSLSTGVTKVYLPYPADQYDPTKIYTVYFIDDAGNRTNMNATYDSAAEAFVFETSHNSVYAVNAVDLATAADNATDNITVKFEQVGASRKYQIMLYADDTKYINGFTAADMTFDLELDHADKDTLFYTVEGFSSNEYATIVTNSGEKYMFNLDGVKASEVTGASFCIGYVTFGGYGYGYFGVDTSVAGANDDIVNTTKSDQVDVIYTVGGANAVVFDKFTPDSGTTKDDMLRIEIEPAKSDLTINVTFPNELRVNNVEAYQDMTVTISGGDLTAPIVFDLGSDNTSATSGSDWYENDLAGSADITVAYTAKDTAAPLTYTTTSGFNSLAASKYAINLTGILSKYIRYTVTVEGAGYRTATYTVYMNDDAETLTFWNNVMDTATIVETAKNESAVRINYLAGDIVEDYQINIYDLSAVVSYFGTTGLTADNLPEYAKYDLNRDGKIDSIDVAYVLVSWGW